MRARCSITRAPILISRSRMQLVPEIVIEEVGGGEVGRDCFADLRGIGDVGTFLTDRIIAHSEGQLDLQEEGRIFRKTFDLLDNALGDDCFRRYNVEKQRFMGGFLVSVFEVIGIGLGHTVDKWNNTQPNREAIQEIAKSIWQR